MLRHVLRLTGFSGARRLGALLAAVHYRFNSAERRRCLRDLALLQERTPGDPAIEAQLREAYRVNTIAVLEVLAMVDRKIDAGDLLSHCRVDGLQNIAAARRGKGVILLATHSGNGLLLAAQLADRARPVSVVYRQARMMSAQFFELGLPRYGIQPILANEGFRAYAQMLDCLRRDGILFAMVDQGVLELESGLPMRFLGKVMPMPGGVVQVSRQSRAPILPVTTLGADPVWHFRIDAPIQFQVGGSLEEDLGTVLAAVESRIMAHPQLWSWHQRRWRDFPMAAES